MKYSDETIVSRLLEHRGHDIESMTYGEGSDIHNVALQCNTCGCVVIDYDLDKEGSPVVE